MAGDDVEASRLPLRRTPPAGSETVLDRGRDQARAGDRVLRLENRLEKLEEIRDRTAAELRRSRDELGRAEGQLAAAFPHVEALAEVRGRAGRLQEELDQLAHSKPAPEAAPRGTLGGLARAVAAGGRRPPACGAKLRLWRTRLICAETVTPVVTRTTPATPRTARQRTRALL